MRRKCVPNEYWWAQTSISNVHALASGFIERTNASKAFGFVLWQLESVERIYTSSIIYIHSLWFGCPARTNWWTMWEDWTPGNKLHGLRFSTSAGAVVVICTRWTVDVEDCPGCMFSVCVEGPAGVVALVRALNRWEGENPISDDGAATDTVSWASCELQFNVRCHFPELCRYKFFAR